MKLLIYNENLQVLSKDNALPEIKSDDYSSIKQFVLENTGLEVSISGKRNKDYMVIKIVSGEPKEGYIFEEVKSPKYKELIESDLI
jgi:hypothetical protein